MRATLEAEYSTCLADSEISLTTPRDEAQVEFVRLWCFPKIQQQQQQQQQQKKKKKEEKGLGIEIPKLTANSNALFVSALTFSRK